MKIKFRYPLLLSLGSLLIIVWWTGRHLFDFNIFYGHDVVHHLSRASDAYTALKEGHFPLRWAGSLGYRCGLPIFTFYYPLIYYLMSGLMYMGMGLLMTWKYISFTALAVGTFGMWLWLRIEFDDELAAWLGAVLYLLAPYRFLLVYVRTTPEFLAYAILPVVLWLYSKYFATQKIPWLALATLLGGVWMISHNMIVMLLTPFLLLYLAYKYWLTKNWVRWYWPLLSVVSVIGIGLWFWLPLVVERGNTHLIEPGIFVYSEHFPTVMQLIRSPWNYFYSMPGTENDGMSFQLGYAQWLALIIGIIVWIWTGFIQKKRTYAWWVLGSLLAGSGLCIYLLVEQSIWMWELIPALQILQFPWRLLGVVVFLIALLSAAMISLLNNKYMRLLVVLLLFGLAAIGNRHHLLSQPVDYPDRYDDYETHDHRYATTMAGFEATPIWVEEHCHLQQTPFLLLNGVAEEYIINARGETYGSVDFHSSQSEAQLGLTYYPQQYEVTLDGDVIAYRSCDGYMCFDVSDGDHRFEWQIVQTDIQRLSNWLTAWFVTVWVGLLGYGIYREVRGRKQEREVDDK